MKYFLVGECKKENVFQLVDPTQFLEVEFEAEVVKALTCLLPDYFCGVFAGTFKLDGQRRSSDLALIHRHFTHWFVIEVELTSHSFESHVLPQVRCFQYGEPEDSCITSLCRGFKGLDADRAKSILQHVPRFVAVVANRAEPQWEAQLRAVEVQMLTVSVLRDYQGRSGYEMEGKLNVQRESIGFAKYSAPDNSLRLPKSCGLPVGQIQIEDPFGVVATWVVREDGNTLWITKEKGFISLGHDSYVQVIRTIEGRLSLKPTFSG